MWVTIWLMLSLLNYSLALLSYSIAGGIPVTLTCVRCWNINHQNHKHTYSHKPHVQNDKSNRCHTLYDCDDWYFNTWRVSVSLEFHWQLSNWVGLMWSSMWITFRIIKCWHIIYQSHQSHNNYHHLWLYILNGPDDCHFSTWWYSMWLTLRVTSSN